MRPQRALSRPRAGRLAGSLAAYHPTAGAGFIPASGPASLTVCLKTARGTTDG